MSPPAAQLLRITRPAQMAHLPELLALVEEACDAANADGDVRYAVRLAVEEISVNVIDYGYRGREPGPVELVLAWDDERMTIKIADKAACFAPEDAPAPDLESGWEERSIGGLGWHLVRRLVDTVAHRYEHGNRYTLTKRFAP
jgi:anti-sigma regulatory factor (Ser/Thr protein kinase)